MLADFGLHYPEVQFDVQTNDHQHLFDNDRDLVFFNGELPQSLPNALCLGHIEYGLFASRSIWKMGTPAHPAQLEEHALIYCWPHQHWQLTDRDEQTVQIKRTAKLTVNQTQAAVRAARRHLGIVNARSTTCIPSCRMSSWSRYCPTGKPATGPSICCAASLSLPRCVLRCSLNLLKNIQRATESPMGQSIFTGDQPVPLHLTVGGPHL